MRLRTGVIAIIAAALVVTGGLTFSRTGHDARAPLAQALDLMPPETRVAGFTDWAEIRSTLGLGRVTTATDRGTLVSGAFERDLSARSILESFTPTMVAKYGWSIADLRWEMYGQASTGAVLAAGMNDDLKAAEVTSALRKLGYAETGGIWSLGIDQLTLVAPGLPGTLANIAVLGDERQILASDSVSYLGSVLAMHREHDKSLAAVTAVRETATPLLGAQSTAIQVKIDACASTGLAGETAEVQAQGRNTVKPLGTLVAVEYGARAIFDHAGDQRLRFSMTFGSAAAATRQLKLRSALSSGPFVGRTGQIGDVLTLTSAHTAGSNATLDFAVDPNKGSFMDGEGPLLFAACSS